MPRETGVGGETWSGDLLRVVSRALARRVPRIPASIGKDIGC